MKSNWVTIDTEKEIKSKLVLIIELKNSFGNKLPTNILDLKSVLGKNNIPKINALKIDEYDNWELIFLEKKPKKIVTTAAQQNKSANKNKYKILNPFDAKIKTKIHIMKII